METVETTEETTGKSRRRSEKLLFLTFSGAISIFLLVIGGYQLLDFSDSTAFCGRLCHNVMYPEYTAYQASPHSRVLCSECHVGPGADYLVRSKVSGVPLIFATIFGRYDRPISTPVENLRPARETCERCHSPERFSGDIVRVHATYATDEANTRTVDTRVLRVGGGESDIARDIHWHITANVWYVPLDKARQEIGWVGVENKDGGLTEYIDPARVGEINLERIQSDRRLMDCVDCHNRATHIFRSPDELIDMALAQGEIDSTIPFFKRGALSVLDPPAASLDEAIAKVRSLKDFYRDSLPQVVAEKEAALDQGIKVLEEIARLTTFPYMNVTWDTYVDNAAHQESPGCFRCHGKLEVTSGADAGKLVDVGCDTCHYFELEKIQ